MAANTAAAIWATIALAGLLVAAGPSAPSGDALSAVRAASGLALAAAVFSIASKRMTIKPWLHLVVLTVMTLDVGVLYLAGGSLRAELALLFAFVAVYGAYFFSGYVLVTQLGIIAVVIAAPGLAPGSLTPAADQVTRLVLLFPALCLTGTLVAFLRRQVERREAHLDLQAGQDPTSGLLNAVGFARMLDFETLRATRNSRPIVVLVLEAKVLPGADHPLGEARLARMVGRTIAGQLDSTDHAARLDRAQFALSGPDAGALTGMAGALVAAISARLAAVGYPHDAVDVRIGKASFPIDAEQPDRLVKIAQDRLAPAELASREPPENAGQRAALEADRAAPASAA